ncbi:MAG: transglycosylase SLT domain-containing protein, partial [Synechocystis sp.]
PHSEVAPKAVFWIGKWAQQLGRPDDAKAAFENVLARYPQSYYAWRSAVLLGWQVGDFNTVRFLNPPVTVPSQRPIPPAGSATFKELFRLAQDQAAIELFEAELQAQKSPENPSELPVNEGFTQALLKLTQQEYLQGSNQVLNLRDPQDPEQRKAWEALRETPEYWQALFPFPYQKLIFDWSAKRQLNPFLVTALIRQESRFEKEIKSPAGATGLMQVMPSTAEWIAPQINLKDYSLTDPTDNVNMGTWYFDHTHQTYNNNSALAVASYNAGPGNVSKWLAEFDNADPDAFVEKIPFRETKGYVESVFGNYWNYLRIYDPDVQQLMSRLPKP